MLFSLCRCQHIDTNHASINNETSILGGRRWHGIWRIRWSPTRHWRSLILWSCVLWRSGWLLTNQRQLMWINDWIIQWRMHRYHRWRKRIDIWVTVIYIKAPVFTTDVLRRAGWLLTNRGQLRWINDWIFQWRRHMYHWWWQLIALWVTFLAIKSPVITRSCSLPTLIFPSSTFVATTNNLWNWHDACNMSLWWCCVPVILFVDVQEKVRANFLAQQPQSFFIFSTRNKIDHDLFVSI